ncbi:SPAC24H6.01c, partial [Cucurbita argyrosperma subsp. argyrosperma]
MDEDVEWFESSEVVANTNVGETRSGLGGRWIKEVGLGVLLWETVCGVGGVGVCKGINENLVLWDGQALKVLKRDFNVVRYLSRMSSGVEELVPWNIFRLIEGLDGVLPGIGLRLGWSFGSLMWGSCSFRFEDMLLSHPSLKTSLASWNVRVDGRCEGEKSEIVEKLRILDDLEEDGKHSQRCQVCKSGRTCYQLLQERGVQDDKFTFTLYLCYLVYAPLYLAGPIVSFNAFASQLDVPQNNYKLRDLAWYGLRWTFCFLLMEVMTHLFRYNALAISGLWKQLSPLDVFIIGYGVLNFMWLKFLLIWRYFRYWSLIYGIDSPENMPKCINNCYDLEGFWKSWHASYNKWIVRYMYIPLGGSKRKVFNVWIVFTFVAIWHDLEWKLLCWAWLTCLFFVPEMVVKSAVSTFKAESAVTEFVFRELSAIAGAITITCLMVANLVGYVIGPSSINSLASRFLNKQGLPVLGGMFVTFYVGTK